MLTSIIYLAVGSVMLYLGSEWIVKGSVSIADRLGISPLVIGLTIVAFGTSLPELIVSIIAAIEGSSEIAVGNVVGSNIANVGLVLGLSAIIFPISIHYSHLRRDLFIYLVLSGSNFKKLSIALSNLPSLLSIHPIFAMYSALFGTASLE